MFSFFLSDMIEPSKSYKTIILVKLILIPNQNKKMKQQNLKKIVY